MWLSIYICPCSIFHNQYQNLCSTIFLFSQVVSHTILFYATSHLANFCLKMKYLTRKVKTGSKKGKGIPQALRALSRVLSATSNEGWVILSFFTSCFRNEFVLCLLLEKVSVVINWLYLTYRTQSNGNWGCWKWWTACSKNFEGHE